VVRGHPHFLRVARPPRLAATPFILFFLKKKFLILNFF